MEWFGALRPHRSVSRNCIESFVMPKRILVADGDHAQRRIIEETIKRFGYGVAVAESGDKAVAMLRTDAAGDISLVLLDLMPGSDGMALLTAIRALPHKTPVIVQTAQGGIDAALAAMRSGAFDFVVKPVSPERLEISIKNALKIEISSRSGLTGLTTKSKAPERIAAKAASMPPWAVCTMTGVLCGKARIAVNRAIPSLPGIRSSNTRLISPAASVRSMATALSPLSATATP